MPPKKEEQSKISQYKPCFVLPIFINGSKSAAANALARPVTIKKNIDNPKIIQILKDKGLQQYIVNGQINEKGRIFACQNLKTVCDEFIVSLNKPVDPKKDAKKDAKKQAKKEQPVVENVTPPIEIDYQKNCNDFFVYLSLPCNASQLKAALSKDIKIDIVVLIEQKVKPGSRKPNYNLLNNQKSIEDIANMMQQTVVDADFLQKKPNTNKIDNEKIAKQQVQAIKQYKSNLPSDSASKNIIILNVPYLDDLSKPEDNDVNFIRNLFQRVCKCTKQLEQFIQWKNTRKLVPMIQPIKQVITKQVQVQEKADKNKKSGKSAQPVFETVTETIEKRYQDQPQNIKSDMKQFYKAKSIREQNNKKSSKGKTSIFNQILTNCIEGITSSTNSASQSNTSNQLDIIAQRIRSQHQIIPINKITKHCIANNVRQIDYFKNISMNYKTHFQFPSINTNFSFTELCQKSQIPTQELRMQYIIKQFENMAKKANQKIIWNFKDRQYIQNFSKEQLIAIVNQQLEYDPEVFTARVDGERLNLLVLSRTNPPGRVLYHNSIFNWKVMPDFQNWNDYFLASEEQMKTEEFLDYSFDKAGNLAIKAKNMMPADNTIIRDEVYTIGSNKSNIIQVYKENSKFGLTKNTFKSGEQGFSYWHQIDEQYRMRIFKTTKTGTNNEEEDRDKNQGKQEAKVEDTSNKYETLTVLLANKKDYRVMLDPNPTFYWENPVGQRMRSFSSLGTITSYRTDGSIHIYTPTGQVSIYKNGKWTHTPSQPTKPLISLSEGQQKIQIFQNQTIIITDSKENKKIIFIDGTQIIENKKQRKREIKNPRGPFIRIYLPRNYNFNIIGYGSAFAYLGFTNILQRSYDGYLFQIVDAQISLHYYVEKYQRDGKIVTDQIRLIAYQDGSMLKINSRQGTIVFNSTTPNQMLTEQVLNERWLQTYTTKSNHGQGVFDIDLNIGHISNKDSETNKFVAKVNDRSQAHIAVSFITQDQQNSTNTFPNGFHIKQENYFLPPPKNCIPARLFSINQDGSGTEYLSSHQIGSMSKYSVTKQYQGRRQIIQYCKEASTGKDYLNVTFSKPVNIQNFGLPDVLKTPQTKQGLIPVKFENVCHRVLENIRWSFDYSGIEKLEEQLKAERENKKNRKQARKVQPKQLKKEAVVAHNS